MMIVFILVIGFILITGTICGIWLTREPVPNNKEKQRMEHQLNPEKAIYNGLKCQMGNLKHKPVIYANIEGKMFKMTLEEWT